MDPADEATPLLGLATCLPPIAPTLTRISALAVDHIQVEDIRPYGVTNRSTESAFVLIVLLRLRQIKLQPNKLDDIYKNWSRRSADTSDAKIIEKNIAGVWTLFLEEYRSHRDIATVLWTDFFAEEGSTKTFRVIDFLGDVESPTVLTSHPIVTLSLSKTWQLGHPSANDSSFEWLKRYDELCTPRTSYCIELFSHLVFIALLVQYLLHPTRSPRIFKDRYDNVVLHELLLVFFPLSFMIRPWYFSNIVFFVVPLAFFLSFPFVPLPGEMSFVALLWGVALHVFRLHLPLTPSPIFLFPLDRSLPLAVLLSHGLYRCIFPVIIFFLPALLCASFLLSFSLADTFLKIQVYSEPLVIHTPAPMETRITFLFFFGAVLLLILLSAFVLAAALPSMPQNEPDTWDRYSQKIGQAARRAMLRVVVSYPGLYTFPPPFNMLHLLLIRIPRSGGHIFGSYDVFWGLAERVLWRITVGPPTVLLAILNQGTKIVRRPTSD